MSSRRIRAMAQLIETIEDDINAWYRTGTDRNGMKDPVGVLSALAVYLAGYRRDFKGEPKAES